jgi:ribosomal protein S12 methylthiotransferase accessory factor
MRPVRPTTGMRSALDVDYLNSGVEFLPGSYDEDRARQITALTRLFNRWLGPVTLLKLHRPDIVDLPMYSSSCNHVAMGALIADLAVRSSITETMFVPSGGKGPVVDQALMGALGEDAERLIGILAYQHLLDGLVFATPLELTRDGRRHIEPDELPLFAPEQYRPGTSYVPFLPTSRIAWVPGTFLASGEDVLVPAQLVLLYYEYRRGEAAICYPTTGGLAFHVSWVRAVLHGIY